MQLISTTTVTSAVSNVTISNIPSTYDTLFLLCYARTARTSENAESLYLRFNSDTSSNTNYSNVRVYATTTSNATSDSNSGGIRIWVATDKSAAGIYSTASVSIPGYKTTTLNKKATIVATCNSGSSDTHFYTLTNGLWNNTSAISSMYLVTESGGNINVGSKFYLYGL